MPVVLVGGEVLVGLELELELDARRQADSAVCSAEWLGQRAPGINWLSPAGQAWRPAQWRDQVEVEVQAKGECGEGGTVSQGCALKSSGYWRFKWRQRRDRPCGRHYDIGLN